MEIIEILQDRKPTYKYHQIIECLDLTMKKHKLTREEVEKIVLNDLLINVGKFRLHTSFLNLNEMMRDRVKYTEYNSIFHNITNMHFTIDNAKKYFLQKNGKSTHASAWGVNRNDKRADQKLKKYIKFFPKISENTVIVDIGCGDGLDIIRASSDIPPANRMCADIKDERDVKYRDKSIHLTIELGKKLKMKGDSVDIVFLFHVIHHMMDDVYKRLEDIYRILKVGGILCLKDHDVRTERQAKNVDFQHYVYELGTFHTREKNPTIELAKNFPKYMPMNYYNSVELSGMLKRIGFTEIYFNKNNNLTYTFDGVYRKI